MEAAPAPVGVAAAAPAPPPGWPDATQWVPPGSDHPVALPNAAPPAWPRSAQWATALLLALALGLLAWHAYGTLRSGTRPTTLEPDAADTIDLNRADRAQLLQLPGVGEGLARRIEAYRQEHNGFRSVEELRRVGGIGPVMLERLRPLVHVEPYEGGEDSEPAPVAAQPPAPPGRKDAKAGAVGKKKEALTGPVDVNRASAAELQRLPGIGPKLSARIVEARARGPFRSVDELRGRVPGIGAKTLERLRPHVTVGGAQKPAARGD
jgi:competence protein ComEA